MGTKSPTSIEVKLYAALDDLGLEYVPQHRVGWFVVDAYLPAWNTIIEAHGDWFHCNPVVFPEPKYKMQIRNLARDRRRETFFVNRGYRLVLLWEKDINERGARALLEAALELMPEAS
ncbi:MAG: endonuclease domain-containing protein [Chloroflexota bacterium]|nr:endonuclease domain-containing protein [Chloroflexota bacterium]